MTTIIHAPAGVRRAGVGPYALMFDESGRCPDPGLNAGERAYLQGYGYRFGDEAAPVAEPAPEPESEPASEPAPKRRNARARKAPDTDAE